MNSQSNALAETSTAPGWIEKSFLRMKTMAKPKLIGIGTASVITTLILSCLVMSGGHPIAPWNLIAASHKIQNFDYYNAAVESDEFCLGNFKDKKPSVSVNFFQALSK